jgi:hypothetical protein
MRARSQPWTVDDFLAFEAGEPEGYEFVDGIVRMMTRRVGRAQRHQR